MLFVNKNSFIADIVFDHGFGFCFLNCHVIFCVRMIFAILMIADIVLKAYLSRLSTCIVILGTIHFLSFIYGLL